MKQEAEKKNKKWLWLVIGLALLLIVVGVLLAVILNPGQGDTTNGVAAELYWNIDRVMYTENAEVEGLSNRVADADGVYRMRFAYKGEQVNLPIADKQLVNWIDQRDLVALVLDADGVVVDAVEPDEVAVETYNSFYVQKVEGNTVTLNSSIAMNGMQVDMEITDPSIVYDVDPDAEVVGAIAEAGVYDQLLVYSDAEENLTHIYITERAPVADIYWRLERMYDSTTKLSTRVPDENGVYSIDFVRNSEYVTLKTKDVTLVNYVDSQAQLSGMFAPVFDEEGYIIEFVNVAMALRGKEVCRDYHVTAIDGNNITATKIGSGTDQGKVINFTLSDACDIFMCCTGCYDECIGERITELQLNDRIYLYSDMEGGPILLFVARRDVDSPVYYNLERKYSNGASTREPEADGYYVFNMVTEGKALTVRTKDKDIVNEIDAQSTKVMGLKLDGDIVESVYPITCLGGDGNYATNRYVTQLNGLVLQATFYTDFSIVKDIVMAPDCKIYDATTGYYGVTTGEETTISLYDRITYLTNMEGQISTIFVTDRYTGDHPLYYNLSRKYSSETESTTREPDAEGYYVFDMLCEGKAVTVKTKNKSLASYIDKQSAPIVALKVSGDIVKEAYPAYSAILYGYKTASYQYVDKINKDGTFTTYWLSNGEVNYSTYTYKMTDDCTVYNVSSGYEKYRGEKTTLRVGDQIQAFAVYPTTWPDADICQIFVLNRKLASPMYKNVQQMYDWDKLETTREPNADGWYVFDLAANGEIKQFKTKDRDIATQVDSYELGFTMVTEGDIIIRAGSPTLCDGVYNGAAAYHDVMALNGRTATLTRNQPNASNYGNTLELTFAEDCVYYDYSPYAEKFGAETTLGLGDRIHCYVNSSNEVIICFILYKNTHEEGHISYCEHCGKEVFWNPYYGGIGARDAHYYVTHDGLVKYQGTVNEGYDVVLDLNGHTMTRSSYALLVYGNLSIIDTVGGGGISASSDAGDMGGIIRVKESGALDIRGGTFTRSIFLSDDAQLTLSGSPVISGGLSIPQGMKITLGELTKGANILVSATGVFTEETAKAEIYKDYFKPVGKNAEILCDGNALSYVITGTADPKDVIAEAATARAENWCPVCQKSVSWAQVRGQVYDPVDGGHYYFQDAEASGTTYVLYDLINWLGNENAGYNVCLNLNGYTVTTGRRMTIHSGTVNIINGGVLLGTGENTTNVTGTLTISGGTVNLYGGTYQSTDDNGAPAIRITDGTVNLYDAVVNGGIDLTGGTVNLYGTTKVVGLDGELTDNINVTRGKLVVSADWTGTASASFPSITDKVVAEANGASGGAFTGKLYLEADGNPEIAGEDGKLVIIGEYDDSGDEPVDEITRIIEEAKTARVDNWCPVCQKSVTWTQVRAQVYGPVDGGHYYFQDTDASGSTYTLYDLINWQSKENEGYTVCLNLNGYNVTTGRRMLVSSGTVNIINGGVLLGTGENTTNVTGTLTVTGGTVNLYGGTYQSTDDDGAPAINMSGADTVINLYNATVNGGVDLLGGTLNMYGTSTVVGMNGELTDNINITNGKLMVGANWTGTASASFPSIIDKMIAEANGASEGAYTGKLHLEATGSPEIAGEDGKLVIIGEYDDSSDEVVDEITRIIEEAKTARADNWCPVCQKTVTWTQVRAQVYGPVDGGHYYFQDDAASGSVTAKYDLINWLSKEKEGYTVCLNLNGYNVTTERRMTVSSGTVNIINGGVLLGNGLNPTNVTGTLTVSGGTVNLYGGTYQSTDVDGAPAINMTGADTVVNLYNATVNGRIDLTEGTLNMYGTSKVVGMNGEMTDNINVTGGKLMVGANWTGLASAKFPTITDNVVNEANGASEGAYTGALYLEGGNSKIVAQDGKLVVEVSDADKIIAQAKTARADKWCPVCQKTVTWTQVKAQVYDPVNGGHYYFQDTDATGTTNCKYDLINWLSNANAGYTVCLNLNGYNVITERRMTVSSGTVNIINGGVMLGNGLNATNVTGTLTVSGGTVNLYGGTYQSTDDGGAPAINITGADTVVNLYNATVNGRIDLTEGTLNMYGTSTVIGMNGELTDNIHVTGGKLVVGSEWIGTASVSFETLDGATVPAANGASQGGYYGMLYLEDEEQSPIIAKDGGLFIDYANPAAHDGVLKILAIGNSFAVDSTNLLYEIYKAENPDKEVVIGVLNLNGGSLSDHVSNINGNVGAYYYHKLNSSIDASSGAWRILSNATVQHALKDEQWDIVTMQQASGSTPNFDSYNADIGTIRSYVTTNLGYEPEFAWNFTWAYPDDDDMLGTNTASFVENFKNGYGTSANMYDMIRQAVQEKIVGGEYSFDYIMPAGTAIQNARAYGLECIELYRDALHLNNLGRLIAAYTWYCEFEGYDGTDMALTELKLTDIPEALALSGYTSSSGASSDGVTQLDEALEKIVVDAVNNALKSKFEVVQP